MATIATANIAEVVENIDKIELFKAYLSQQKRLEYLEDKLRSLHDDWHYYVSDMHHLPEISRNTSLDDQEGLPPSI